MKIVLLVTLMISSLFSMNIIMPTSDFKADGAVTDIVYNDAKLYAATSAGVVNIFDIKSKKIVQSISVKKIKDFMGDEINAKIYSVDILGTKILLLSQGLKGYRELSIYENKKLTKVISISDKLSIAKAKFIDNDNVILALLGNDLISYNIKSRKENWIIQVSQSKFSNFALNEAKSEVVVADESGELHIFSTTDAKLLKTLSGQNLDNVFAVDYKNSTIATAGQDRRAVIYDLNANTAYYKTSHFLIYGVGLSPSASLAAYASDEKNNVTVFKTNTQSRVGVYGGNKMTLTKILFISENEFFISTDDKVINLYKIK